MASSNSSINEAPVPRNNQPISFTLEKIIGKSRASVFYALRTDGGTPISVVVKQINLALDEGSREQQTKFYNKQLSGLLTLDHPNVVRHLHHQSVESDSPIAIPIYSVVMEHLSGGDLAERVKQVVSLSEIQTWMKQILQGLQYLHEKCMVHRDIKCENIIFSGPNFGEGLLKIADLGDLAGLQAEATKSQEVSHDHGSAAFMSPEMIQTFSEPKAISVGRKTDIWSFGCTVVQIISGIRPVYLRKNNGQLEPILSNPVLMKFIVDGGKPEIPDKIPTDVKNVIISCLNISPSERPACKDLLMYPFLVAENTASTSWTCPPRPKVV